MSDTVERFMAGESLQNIINERTCELVDYSAPVLDQLGVASDKALHQIMSEIRAELAAAHEREKALRELVENLKAFRESYTEETEDGYGKCFYCGMPWDGDGECHGMTCPISNAEWQEAKDTLATLEQENSNE